MGSWAGSLFWGVPVGKELRTAGMGPGLLGKAVNRANTAGLSVPEDPKVQIQHFHVPPVSQACPGPHFQFRNQVPVSEELSL